MDQHHQAIKAARAARGQGGFVRLAVLGALLWRLSLVGAPAADDTNAAWAFAPVVPPKVPVATNGSWARTAVDHFVLARLTANDLAPAPEADRRTLIRRVYFDLIGLPPTPEEVAAFLADSAPGAYERLVEHLLASPRYGERWARHWMDAVHFAETHGNDQDRIRTNAWPYRDYLITRFNDDVPYSRFVQEQVAGDVLFPEDPAATVALGFLAAGPWDESSLRDIREDTLDRQIGRYLDRDDVVTTVMQTFTSTTVHCARCHDHKFDPISQRDYYALQAVFAGVDRANRTYDPDPATHQRRQALRQRKAAIEKRDPAILASLLSPAVQRDTDEWERSLAAQVVSWTVLPPEQFTSSNGVVLTKLPDGSLRSGGPRPERDTYVITARASLTSITAIRLEVLADDQLPLRGPGRQDNGNLHLSEFQVFAERVGSTSGEPRGPLAVSGTADFDQAGWTIAHALDGNEKTAWGIYPKVGQPHQAVFELKQPLAGPMTLTFVLKQLHGGGHLIGRPRLSVTEARPPVRLNSLPDDLAKILAVPAAQRSDAQRIELTLFRLKEQTTRELAALPRPAQVYAAASEFEPDGGLKPAGGPRLVQVLRRGDITKPIEPAAPGALTSVRMLPARFVLANAADEGARRAALARWLTQPDNPLTWRSIVNRVWRLHFGRGLVDTPNDFGRMGSAPSHPELLDWLAGWFRDDARGSLKQLHRLLVTSAAYRQSSLNSQPSTLNSTTAAPDADNRLLSHMNRTRLDAEQVRDTILQVSGRLDLRMGGPSDHQFDLQPGIHVTPRVDYAKFDLDGPAGRRRGVYRFLFRTLPDPFMDALDCPAGDQLTAARNAGVTVQQALALWNNAFVARHAAHFAARLERETTSLDGQVTRAFVLALNRPPSAAELAEFVAYAQQHGLANVCRLLFNSNEFMFVN